MRLPGVAPGPSPWQEDILLLNHSRESKRAGSVLTLPARTLTGPTCQRRPRFRTTNKHLLAIYSIPTRGFKAAVSVFRGTPPPKPLDCKIWLNTIGASLRDRWGHPTGGEPRLSRAISSIVSVDILKMSPSFRSQFVHLLLCDPFPRSGKTKNPASFRQAGFGKI